MFLLALAGPDFIEKAAEPALGVVAQTTLGAIAILTTLVATVSVYKLSSVQDSRANDAKQASDKAESLILKMLAVQNDSQRTLDAFVQAERQSEQVSREQTSLLQQIKQSVDTTIRDAILRGARSQTPPPGDGRRY